MTDAAVNAPFFFPRVFRNSSFKRANNGIMEQHAGSLGRDPDWAKSTHTRQGEYTPPIEIYKLDRNVKSNWPLQSSSDKCVLGQARAMHSLRPAYARAPPSRNGRRLSQPHHRGGRQVCDRLPAPTVGSKHNKRVFKIKCGGCAGGSPLPGRGCPPSPLPSGRRERRQRYLLAQKTRSILRNRWLALGDRSPSDPCSSCPRH